MLQVEVVLHSECPYQVFPLIFILQCKNNVESLLLWLSIIRKVFTPVPTSAPAEVPIPSSLGLDLVSVSASAKRATNSSAREIVDLKPVQRTLLRASALVPALVSSMKPCFSAWWPLGKGGHMQQVAKTCTARPYG